MHQACAKPKLHYLSIYFSAWPDPFHSLRQKQTACGQPSPCTGWSGLMWAKM